MFTTAGSNCLEIWVNWFDNSVEASRAQVAFATKMAPKYKTLGPNAWGLTACDGPDGYNGLYGAPPSGYDNNQHVVDDTIAPSSAIGSIIFVPEDAKRVTISLAYGEQTGRQPGYLMQRAQEPAAEVASLPLYPEERASRTPTANTIFRIFSLVDRESIFGDEAKIADFEPELTELQLQLLELLNVPKTAYVPS